MNVFHDDLVTWKLYHWKLYHVFQKQKTPAKLKNQFCEVFVYLKMKKDELTEKLKAH